MTRDALHAFESLRDLLKGRLAEIPEYRALMAIEASMKEIRSLPGFDFTNGQSSLPSEASKKTHNGSLAEAVQVPACPAPLREPASMALAIARSVEGNIATVRTLRPGELAQ